MSHYDYSPAAAAEYETRKAANPQIYYDLEKCASDELSLYQQGLIPRDEMHVTDLLNYWKSKQYEANQLHQQAMSKMEELMDEQDRAELEQWREAERVESRQKLIERVTTLARIQAIEAARKSTNRATFLAALRKQGKQTDELVKEVGCEADLMNKLFLAECLSRGW